MINSHILRVTVQCNKSLFIYTKKYIFESIFSNNQFYSRIELFLIDFLKFCLENRTVESCFRRLFSRNWTLQKITILLSGWTFWYLSTFSASNIFFKKVCTDRSKGPWIYQPSLPPFLQKDKSRTAITLLSFLPFVCLPPRFFLSIYQSSNYFFPLPPLIFTARSTSTPSFLDDFRRNFFPSHYFSIIVVRANVTWTWSRSSPSLYSFKKRDLSSDLSTSIPSGGEGRAV